MTLRQEIMLELLTRMSDHMDAGLDMDAALQRAAEEMRRDICLHRAECAVAIEAIETDSTADTSATFH
jgi:hypothetical protein